MTVTKVVMVAEKPSLATSIAEILSHGKVSVWCGKSALPCKIEQDKFDDFLTLCPPLWFVVRAS
jgi:DNA topoisomerase IA